MDNIIIRDGELSAEIAPLGAEIQKITYMGKERLWCGDKNVWMGHAPILFPIGGMLRDGKYELRGKTYFLKKHGFAREMIFSGRKTSENSACFTLSANDSTRAVYPFDFVLQVTYTVKGGSVSVGYKVENRGADKMWFSIGSHEAYALDGKFTDYSIIFDKKENLCSNKVNMDTGLLLHDCNHYGDNADELKLDYSLFDSDALIFKNVNSRRVFLAYKGKKEVMVDFQAPILLIWTKRDAKYVCIEPWLNYPDYEDGDGKIENKEGLVWLTSGEYYENIHSLSFLD